MEKIQYETFIIMGDADITDDITIKSLNRLGQVGWILVSALETDYGNVPENGKPNQCRGLFYRVL